MDILNNRKGITPVIAIVLLLLVTVGAVGVVYTQFQNIVDQGSTEADYLDSVNAKISVVRRNTSNSQDQMSVVIENTGESEYNLSDIAELRYAIPGERLDVPVGGSIHGFTHTEADQNCFTKDSMQSLAPGDLAVCNSGVQMPSPGGDEITIQLTQSGADQGQGNIDDYTCQPSTSDSTTC